MASLLLAKLRAQPTTFRTGSEIDRDGPGSEPGLTSATSPMQSPAVRRLRDECDRRQRRAFRARQGGWRRRQRRSIGEECRSPAIVRGGFRISSAAGARRGPGVGRSHWAEIERSQRGALSAPFPSPPAGPAPWFWRQGVGCDSLLDTHSCLREQGRWPRSVPPR